jgi:hypothetical protein
LKIIKYRKKLTAFNSALSCKFARWFLEVEAFKADQSHDRPYVEQWAEQLRATIEKLQPSLRPEISLEL